MQLLAVIITIRAIRHMIDRHLPLATNSTSNGQFDAPIPSDTMLATGGDHLRLIYVDNDPEKRLESLHQR